jgi:hypothetical protein
MRRRHHAARAMEVAARFMKNPPCVPVENGSRGSARSRGPRTTLIIQSELNVQKGGREQISSRRWGRKRMRARGRRRGGSSGGNSRKGSNNISLAAFFCGTFFPLCAVWRRRGRWWWKQSASCVAMKAYTALMPFFFFSGFKQPLAECIGCGSTPAPDRAHRHRLRLAAARPAVAARH